MLLSDTRLNFTVLLKRIIIASSLLTSSYVAASQELCNEMSSSLQKMGVSSVEASEYAFDVSRALKQGKVLDYLQVDLPEHGTRYLMLENLLGDYLELREGRTQTVEFDMLKRLPRSSIKMDYVVSVGSGNIVNHKRVEALIAKATRLGVRFFPVVTGEAYKPLLQRLASGSKGRIIDLSSKGNPCAKLSSDSKLIALQARGDDLEKNKVDISHMPLRHQKFADDLIDVIKD